MRFFVGSGMSALQNEGTRNSGKTNWDIAHENGYGALDGSSPENGAKFLEHYEEDLDFLRSMGMKHFRTSIMWARLMPDGRNVDASAVDAYLKSFQYCNDNLIDVNLTIFHWDTPKALQDAYGGWANDQIIDDYVRYAITVVELFHPYVSKFATFNETICFTWLAHGTPEAPALFPIGEPLKNDEEKLKTIRRVLLAHSKAYHAIKQKHPCASIGIVDNPATTIPLNPMEFGVAQLAYQDAWLNGAIIFPLLTGQISKCFGKTDSCNGRGLLNCDSNFLTDQDIELISSAKPDWLGLNSYSGLYVDKDSVTGCRYVPYSNTHPQYHFSWLKLCPSASYYAVKHVRETLGYTGEVLITESGCAEADLNDTGRIVYLESLLSSINRLNHEGYDVSGVYVWTLTDNWEWTHGGCQVRFGLCHVDYDTYKRTPRASSRFLKGFIEEHSQSREIPSAPLGYDRGAV